MIQKNVKVYALTGFLLLAVLFGMQIFTFLFADLGVASSDSIADLTATITNESSAYANATDYTLVGARGSRFVSGTITITDVWADWNQTQKTTNLPSGYNISVPLTNISVNAWGIVTNATATNYTNISISYSYDYKSDAKVISESVNNDSLNAINNYSSGAGTQFNVLQIAITLILLVGIFFFFWKSFMGGKKSGGGGETFA